MIYLNKYEIFIEKEIYEYIDNLLLLNEEKIDFTSIQHKIQSLLNKIKNFSKESKRKYLIYFITSLLSLTTIDNVINAINQTKDSVAISIVDEKFKLKDVTEMFTSEEGKEHIKDEEKLRLSAYSIGDGMITIGWGHAEKKRKSKFKLGQTISREFADKLFEEDIKVVENGIKRIFQHWKDKGIDRKITQSQFDALVSMGYNMGIGNLRKSDVIRFIKSGQYKKAGEVIKYTNIDDKFPGLEKRRFKESTMFLSYLGNNDVNKSI